MRSDRNPMFANKLSQPTSFPFIRSAQVWTDIDLYRAEEETYW